MYMIYLSRSGMPPRKTSLEPSPATPNPGMEIGRGR